MVGQVFQMLKQQKPNVKAEVWQELKNELLQTMMDDLVTKLIPVYSKHLTQKDLEGLISFYETPVGKKYAESTPLIMQESIMVGQQWGMQIGQKLVAKLKEKGY